MFRIPALRAASRILEETVTELSERDLLPRRPRLLYHYTSLETAEKIISNDDLRLSHAEYSNDQRELAQAKDVIADRISAHAGDPLFLTAVKTGYEAQAKELDAYIFCMSTGLPGVAKPQDMLSQWRAYGQDGRGGCLTFQTSGLSDIVFHMPGLRINPVRYEQTDQVGFVDEILRRGCASHAAADPDALDGTIASLIWVTPIMKDVGFAEEREWRLIYMPSQGGPPFKLGFQPRRDFLAPYVTLQTLWAPSYRQALRDAGLQINQPPVNVDEPAPPLTPITEMMVGPSGHQPLNIRTMQKVVTQAGRPIAVDASAIPYRSLG